MTPAFPALVTVLGLLLYVAEFVAVSRARVRHGIKAPAVTGSPEFERIFRVQQNTLEQLIWFIPSLWLFALFVSPLWAGLIGLIWVAARAHYAVSYCRDPETRGPGYATGLASAGVLLTGALIATVMQLL
jgi:glutathione S-transferase